MITINELFEHWDVTRQDICESLNIPYRSLQNWLTGSRKCPDYVILLLDEWMSHHCIPRNVDSNYCYKAMKEYYKKSEYWRQKAYELSDIEMSNNE